MRAGRFRRERGIRQFHTRGGLLNLEFTKSPLDPRITLARASSGTFFDGDGVLQTASNDVARIKSHVFDGTNWVNRGLLIEEERTNSCLRARDFTGAAWGNTNTTAANDVTGLDGVANSASTLTATASNGTSLQTVTLTSAEYTFSVYVRRKTGTGTINITDNGGTNVTDITGDINSSTFTRVNITRTQTDPRVGFQIVTSGDEIEVDYAQVEPGAFPTSPITTGGSAVTREVDVASMSDLGWYNGSGPGTFYIQGSQPVAVDNRYLFAISDGTANNRILILENGVSDTQHFISDGGVTQASLIDSVDWADGIKKKMAFAFAANDAAAYTDGSQSGTDGSVTLPTGLNVFYIGANQTGGAQWSGHIARITYWNRRLENAILQEITT